MEETPPARRPLSLADLFLVFIGLGIGFAIVSQLHAVAQGRREIPGYEDAPLVDAGPIELLATGASFGLVFAFTLARGRDAWANPAHRRFRLADGIASCPLVMLALAGACLLTSYAFQTGSVFSIPLAFLLIASAVATLVAGQLSMIGLLAVLDGQGTWLDLLAFTTAIANGAIVLRWIAKLI